MDYKDLGNRVRIARRSKTWTQEELAEKVGISASFLGHIERGTRVASLETFVSLCNELCVTPEYLLANNLHLLDESVAAGMDENEKAKLQEFLENMKERHMTASFFCRENPEKSERRMTERSVRDETDRKYGHRPAYGELSGSRSDADTLQPGARENGSHCARMQTPEVTSAQCG